MGGVRRAGEKCRVASRVAYLCVHGACGTGNSSRETSNGPVRERGAEHEASLPGTRYADTFGAWDTDQALT